MFVGYEVMEKYDIVKIHSYKHDKTIHRVWNNITVLEKKEHELVVGNYKTRVIESNGRYWTTSEPAICFFYDNEWFNIIAMLKDDGIYYYCNISSPYVYDEEAIKYIDYDLDLRIDSKYNYRILDRDEYRHHSKIMGYSDELKEVLENSLKNLIEFVSKKEGPFNHQVILNYFEEYKKNNPHLSKYNIGGKKNENNK